MNAVYESARRTVTRGRIAAAALAVYAASALAPPPASAQTPAASASLAHLNAHRAALGFTAADLSDVVVSSETHHAGTGLRHVYLQQRLAGIPVHEGILAVTLTADTRVGALGDRFVRDLASRANATAPSTTPTQAIAAAAADRGLTISGVLTLIEPLAGGAPGGVYSPAGISRQNIPVRLSLLPRLDGTVRLVWDVEIYTLDEQHYWSVRVDAVTNAVLSVDDRVIDDHWGEAPRVESDAHLSRARGAAAPTWSALPLSLAAPGLRAAARETPATASMAGALGARTARSAMATAGTYRVYDAPVETPLHGARTLVTTAGDPIASPLGWHNDGVATYPITRGNNVYATLDTYGAEVGTSPFGGLDLVFDFPVDFANQPAAYSDAAVTNLFYWNNLIHDLFFPYGFDEVSGNFQVTNLSGEGLGGDGVLAQAQDGGGTNNANFLTLPDGVPGRMQMYLWESSEPATLRVNTPPAIAADYLALPAGFGPALGDPGLTGDLVYAVPANGCGVIPPTPLPAGFIPKPFDNAAQVAGKLALVDRGGCSFAEKAINAQISGATGLVVANNVPGAAPITMGSSSPAPAGPDPVSAGISIPAVMVTFETGATIKAQLPSMANPMAPGVNATMLQIGGPSPLRDGDFDNGVVTHEYGHGISTRLTGGPNTTCLTGQEQGGEGWSDWFGLMVTMKAGDAGTQSRGIGNYVTYRPTTGPGIRPAPYTTNMGVNPYTYAQVNNPEIAAPHGVGFIWASMLWEATWLFIDRYGFDPDFAGGDGGNNKLVQLVMEGLKIQPCAPGFVDQRDAILQADRLINGGANHDLLWQAFAKRGLGYSAVQGSSALRTDNIAAFDLPPAVVATIGLGRSVSPAFIPDGTTADVTLTAANATAAALTGLVLRDTLDARMVPVSLPAGATVSGNVVTFAPVDLAPGATAEVSYRVFVGTGAASTFLLRDDVETANAKWTASPGLNSWTRSTASAASGTTAWFAADPDNASDQTLTLASPVAVATGTELSFLHRYNTELDFDGGVVEISTDGGLSWQDLGPHMTQNGYGAPIAAANNPLLADRPAFHGNSGGFVQTRIDLTSFAGQSAQVRFRFASDVLTGAEGWYIDDIAIVTTPTSVAFRGSLSGSGQSARQAMDVFVVGPARFYTAVAAQALLSGAMSGDAMRTSLGSAGHLPTTQPYGGAEYQGTPLYHLGEESVAPDFFAAHPAIVDWVLVELRSDPTTAVVTQAAFVTASGDIVGLDGESPVVFEDYEAAGRYIVVRHRNHLAAMSATLPLPTGAIVRHDFRAGASAAYGTGGQRALTGGLYGLHPGDFDASNDVSILDRNLWRAASGMQGYRRPDVNLDGDVSILDRNVWRSASGTQGTVPARSN